MRVTDLPLHVRNSIKPGQYVRFNALGFFMSVEDYLTNGLGLIYLVEKSGNLQRYHF